METFRECAAEVDELIQDVQPLALSTDAGLHVCFPWGWLVHYLCVLFADGEPRVGAGIREVVSTVLHIHL